MIIINDLSVSYQKGIKVINGLNLQLSLNEVHGLVGLNGSGKTTLLNTIFSIIKQENGSITYNNEKLTKKSIGYLETGITWHSEIG